MHSYAQQPTQEWASRYDGPSHGNETAYCMAIDSSGNVYVSGVDGENPPGFVTVKYNSAGQQIWAKRYAGLMPIMAKPVKIGVDLQNNVYVAGYDQDYILVKYNSAGTQQWVRRYYGSSGGISNLNDMKLTKRGIVVTGYVNNSGAYSDFCTIEYSPNGDTLWAAIYNTSNNGYEVARAMCVDFLGNVIVTGQTANATGIYSPDILTIKYDSNGAEQWVRRYDHLMRWDYGVDVDVNKNGSIYVCGSVQVDSNTNVFCTIKYSPDGTQQWLKTYDGSAHINNTPVKLLLDQTENIVVSGNSTEINGSYSVVEYCTVKYDSLGNQQWVKNYGSNFGGVMEDLAIDKFSNVYVSGQVMDSLSSFGGTYSTTVKYDNSGNIVWFLKYVPAVNNSISKTSIVDKTNNVFLFVQDMLYPAQGSDMLTMKFTQPMGIQPITNILPDRFTLSQNYPNPFNPSTSIKFQIPAEAFIRITIYNMLGEEIAVPLNKQMHPGTYRIEFDGSKLSSGVYFYRIEAGSFVIAKKMVLIK